MNKTTKIPTYQYSITDILYKEESLKDVRVSLSLFAEKLFILITQYDKMGSLIEGKCDSPAELIDEKESTFDIKTLFGSRDLEINEIYCRAIIELLNNSKGVKESFETAGIKGAKINPFKGKGLLLSISVEIYKEEEKGQFLFRRVVQSLKENLCKMFIS